MRNTQSISRVIGLLSCASAFAAIVIASPLAAPLQPTGRPHAMELAQPTAPRAIAKALGVPYTPYNWQTEHAQDRGCNACHGGDLAKFVSQVVVRRSHPQKHGIFRSSYNIPMRVEDCLPCHRPKAKLAFAENIHALHLSSQGFDAMRGGCYSCHATVKGKWVLYDDETRYGVLNGITRVSTPPSSK